MTHDAGGAFQGNKPPQRDWGITSNTQTPTPLNNTWDFDASRVVPTASDIRPKNVYVNYIIKY